jgi:hypothetical protein
LQFDQRRLFAGVGRLRLPICLWRCACFVNFQQAFERGEDLRGVLLNQLCNTTAGKQAFPISCFIFDNTINDR